MAAICSSTSSARLGPLGSMVPVGGYAGGTIEGHTIPMTEVGCSEIRALQEGRQRYLWVNRLSHDIVRQKKFPELRVEVRPSLRGPAQTKS